MNRRTGLWIALAIAVIAALMVSRRRPAAPNEPVAFSHPRDAQNPAFTGSQQPNDQSGFYVLAMSWAPNFCDDPSKPHSSSECDPHRHLGFIVHGLWAQDANGSPAPDCPDASPLPQGTVNQLLQYIPDRGLIAHEWQRHLSCHFTSQNIVAAFQQAASAVQVPQSYRNPQDAISVSPQQIETDFARQNNAQPTDYRTSCHAGKLVNFEACLTSDFKPRACASMPDCPAGKIALDRVP
ncbi:MAG: hypothetical protein JOZ43_07990 [Acidobacteriales bacterium]|nr:hypothetical protein [Terriglobales bacterium]